MIDAPVSMPGNPLGAKGCQLVDLICGAAPIQKNKMAPILISTITVLAPALSFTPRTSSTVTPMVMIRAGKSNQPAGCPGAGTGGKAHWGGKWNPNRLSNRSCKYAEKPTATDMLETAYSRIKSQPMIQATISPRIA